MNPDARAIGRLVASASLLALLTPPGAVITQGLPNQALQFDGVNDNVTLGNPPTLGLSTFTLELWFRRDGAGLTTSTGGVTAVPLLAKGRSQSEGNTRDLNYFFGIDGARRVLVADFEDLASGGNHPIVGTTPICNGLWYHAAATFDGATWRLYLNGALDAALNVGAATPRFDSIQHASIGSALNSNGTAAGFFNGAIDEARIWAGARSASEIQAGLGTAIASASGLVGRWGLDEGAGTSVSDSSGSAAGGTIRSGALWAAGSPFSPTSLPSGNYAIDFAGASDYVSFGAAPGLGSATFTVEAWFKREGAGVTASTGSGGLMAVPLVAKGRGEADGSNRDMNYFLGLDGSGHLAADFEEGAAGASPGLNHPIVGSTIISNDVWYHAAATYDGTTWRLYLNGTLDAELVVGRPPRADSIQHASIGSALNSTGSASGFFNGIIDEVRIWSVARSQAEISSGMLEAPPTAGLLGRWSFNSACGLVADTSGAGRTGTPYGSAWTWVPGVPGPPTTNQPPVVDAGSDAIVTLPSGVALSGVVTDADGPQAVSSTWTRVSGPGSVAFASTTSPATTASFSVSGTYVLRLTATDGASTVSDDVAIQVNPAAPMNQPPVVSAGPDSAITLPSSAGLSGVVTDTDGPQAVASAWTRVSGPGSVAFANATSPATTATFTVSGSYVLRLTATDGAATVSDDVVIQANPPAPMNQAPVVNAGPDQNLVLPASATLSGAVTDDGLPGSGVTATWSMTSGPGVVTFGNLASASTTAAFSMPGTYVLTLSASDGALSATDSVTIGVSAAGSNLALRLGGTGSYVTFGAAPALGLPQFTIEAWVRPLGAGQATSTGSGGVMAVPLVTKGRSEGDGSTIDMNYFLGINTSGQLAADFEEGASGSNPGLNHPVTGSTVLASGTWYHAAATYDGVTWRVYVNGTLDGQLTVNRPPRSDSIQHAGIGTAMNSAGTAAGFFDGEIDEVRIWNVARAQSEVADGMNREIASASGLVGRWGLNETSGTGVGNSAGSVNGTLVGANWSRVNGAPFTSNRAPEIVSLSGPLNGATGVSSSPALGVTVSDPDQQNLTVTFFGRAVQASAPDFTLVAIPDTQHYVDSSNYPIFTAQAQWIVANRSALNVAFVTHLGDIVQNIDAVPLEWQRADVSMNVLDAAGVPNNVSPGNHDISFDGVAQYYDLYFPVARYVGRPWYAGWLGQEPGDVNRENKNNYELFSVGSLDFVIVHLEMDVPDYSLAWANRILQRYSNRRAIISTHIYLDISATRRTSPQFRSNGTSAEQVWQQLVRPNCNVFLIVNGHYHGEAMRTDLNSCGQPVHQVVQDYQDEVNGGDGWLRYFTFSPSQNRIRAFTFSPTRNGGLGEFQTDANSQFTLDYAMQGTPFTTLGSAGVASGASATTVWPGLLPNTRYEWYVTVSDGQTTTTGPRWTFTTQ